MGTVMRFPGVRADMTAHATEVSKILRTLANRNRLLIVTTLLEGEHSVAALEELLGIRQPTLSQQLTVLREAGVVSTRRQAKQVFYRLSHDKVARLVGTVCQIFCREGAKK
ncbi:metalloregulator ArsR/SmtB family transcription factor [Ensifer sp. T173]|uniref:Metalloregulator ArsR/SmtB family transcription factor n=1 Tax=Ensifer canadensis TaxID=555315 RepID=A0AAW4FPT0_9HYPH|nr:metalloregulator ArsR/SmtB family transcription factor [Ensifer canadensis]MBM3093326.1 metalloregulator ArsR/SmtB family transcription factor [Ensifer canadensis]UBI77118.1 metalloregulator ArsR/SmtB family transcription factor [Ensifer canadensis]